MSSITSTKSQRDLGVVDPSRDIILGISLLAWIYLMIQSFQFAIEGSAADLGPGMIAFDWLYQKSNLLGAFGQNIWSICVTKIDAWRMGDFFRAFVMWQIMITAMMVPILLFRKFNNSTSTDSLKVFGRYLAGYLSAWALFSAPMVLLQWSLQTNGLLSDTMTINNPWISVIILAVMGVVQLRILRRKATPDRDSTYSPNGFQHGMRCIQTNWPLMISMFAFGLMNLVYMAALTIAMTFFVSKFAPVRDV